MLQKRQTIFLSIKWKIIIPLIAIVATFIWLSSWMAYDRLNTMFWNNYTELFQERERDFLRLIEGEANNLEQVFDQLITFSQTDDNVDEKKLSQLLEQYWSNIQISNGLKWVRVIDRSSREVSAIGEVIRSPQLEKIEQQVRANLEPVAVMECQASCYLIISIPVHLSHNKIAVIQTAKGLTDIIFNMKMSHNMDVGLATARNTKNTAESQQQQSLAVISVSQGIAQQELELLLKTIGDKSAYMVAPANIEIAKQRWLLELVPLSSNNSDDYLVLMADISTAWQEIINFRDDALLIYLYSLLGIMALATITLWRPIDRIKSQTKLLPLLAEGKFREYKNEMKLHDRSAVVLDEVDSLESTSLLLSDQLSDYQEKIEYNTKDLERAAYFDNLTGLGNRNLLKIRLHDMLQQNQPLKRKVTLLFVDLDDFKTINDSLGHDTGDELLVKIASRLRRCVRDADFIARLGGDEFVLVLNIDNTKDAEAIAAKINYTLSDPISLSGYKVNMSASIGVVLSEDNDTPRDLLKKSDIAMYNAKESGKAGHSTYNDSMADSVSRRFEILAEFDLSLASQEFFLVAQPQYHLDSGKLRGFEVLARWKHHSRGFISPAEFIPCLENSPHAESFGYWVIVSAFEFAKSLRQLSADNDLCISINLMPCQFSDIGLSTYIEAMCKTEKIKPSNIELEITENMLMETGSEIDVLKKLRSIGVNIAVDDFGTGYSSMSYLKNLPLDVLKIDQAFVRNLHTDKVDIAIVDAIITLAKALRLDIVAEGLEEELHIQTMKSHGGIIGQGYALSRPMGLPEALALAEREFANSDNVVSFNARD